MAEFLRSLLRVVLKLVVGLMALVFAVSLICVGLLVVTFTVLKALLTGKKPVPAMVFGRFRQHSPKDIWRRKTAAAPAVGDVSDVVDVEVKDITSDTHPTDTTTPVAARRQFPGDRVVDTMDISDVQPKKPTHPAD